MLWSGAHIVAIAQLWLAWWLHQKNACCTCMRTGVLIPGTTSKAGPHGACIYSQHQVGRDRRAFLGSEYPWISQVKIQWKTLYKRRKRRAVEENTQHWFRPPHACTYMCTHKQRKTKPLSVCSPQPSLQSQKHPERAQNSLYHLSFSVGNPPPPKRKEIASLLPYPQNDFFPSLFYLFICSPTLSF